MRDPLVPAVQRLPGGFLHDGQFVTVSSKPWTASRLVKNVMEVNMTFWPSSRHRRRAPQKPLKVRRCYAWRGSQ